MGQNRRKQKELNDYAQFICDMRALVNGSSLWFRLALAWAIITKTL